MGVDPVTATIASAVLGAVVSSVQGNKQEKQAKKAAAQTAADAKAQAATADREFNRQNAKQPDVQGLQAGNALQAKKGDVGTMLTGPTGVDPDSLKLNKNTLIGA